MSIKTDIINLVNSSEGEIKIASNVILRRWMERTVGEVDHLAVTITGIPADHNGVGGTITDIKARDYVGIVSEIETAILTVYSNAAERLASCIKNGYFL